VGNDERMRAYLSKAPRWIVAVVTGLPFGVMMGIYTKIDGPTSWMGAVLGGLVAGVFFGAVMAFSIDKRRRAMRAAVGDLPTGEAKAARAAQQIVAPYPLIQKSGRRLYGSPRSSTSISFAQYRGAYSSSPWSSR
jgi:hypothetical protein